MRYLLFLPLLFLLSCDPDDDVLTDPDASILGTWRAVDNVGSATFISIDANGDSTISRQVSRLVQPTDYTVTFSADPNVATTTGSVTFERTITYASGRVETQRAVDAGAFQNATWEQFGNHLVTTDPDGESLANDILSLTDQQLIISYRYDVEAFDGFYIRGEATYTFERQ